MYFFKRNKFNKLKSFIQNSKEIQIDVEDRGKLIKLIRPTVGIKTKPGSDKNIKVGKSKIGGKPDLPQDFEWPEANGKPMLFCAQYNLSELAKYDIENILPPKGFFYIFLSTDQEWNDGFGINQPFKFLYSKNENVIRTDLPDELDDSQTFKEALIEYFEFYTLPDDENYRLIDFDEKYHDFYFDFYQPTGDYIVDELYTDSIGFHQILGYDRAIQSSVVYDFASKELGLYGVDVSEHQKRWNDILELSKTYELLLQLDCGDPNTNLCEFWGDGTYYFGLSKSGLANRDFNDIKISYQIT